MPESNLTKLSISLLPIEDIQELLRYQYDFITIEDNATDVNNVAGVPAGKIAEAVSEEDRQTILNSLRLGGKPAKEYLTQEDGGHITRNYQKIREVYSNEIRDLRDELYQLKGELVKRGVVTNYNPYAGFQDAFRNNDPVYLKDPLAEVLESSMEKDEVKIPEYAFKDLDVDDFIVLHMKDIGRFHVARVTRLMPNGETVKFSPASAFDIKGGTTDLYKSLGMYDNGSFAFIRPAEKIPTSQEAHSTLNDDTNRHRRNITAPNRGFGYTFRIPNTMFAVNGEPKTEGYLVRAQAKVTRFGTPGSLIAYVINENDIPNFRNPQQAEDDGILLAKSQPVLPPNEQIERLVEFDFWDGHQYPIIKNDETVDKKTRFCLIVEATGLVDASNYYRVMFLQHKDPVTGELGDLQLNNITYEYTQKENNSDEHALITNGEINSADLYYGIITKGIVTNGIIPYREGVYTAKVTLQEPVEISRARLMLRVNREGYYVTGNTNAASIQDGNNLLFHKDPVLGNIYDMQEIAGIGAKNHDDWVVVGKQLRKLISQNQDAIQLDKGVFLEGPEQPIYRVGYKVYLKAIRKVYRPEWNIWEEKERVKIELPLSAVMPDRMKRSDKISDRLIFENEFIDTEDPDLAAKYFNEFELQVYWKTEYSAQFDNDRYKEHFLGRIHDLSLSFDKSI
ncbi:hypothetical protein MOB78_12415 [Bacillus spizizenii]|nr:hypothetical protein [Bacillus spizizenii]